MNPDERERLGRIVYAIIGNHRDCSQIGEAVAVHERQRAAKLVLEAIFGEVDDSGRLQQVFAEDVNQLLREVAARILGEQP